MTKVEDQIDLIVHGFTPLRETREELDRWEFNLQAALRKLVEYAKEERRAEDIKLPGWDVVYLLDERKKRMEQERKPTREDLPFDAVEKPEHYNKSKYEHQAVAQNWEMSAWVYCATKYLMRCPFKENMLVDLKKGRWYLRDIVAKPNLGIATYGYWEMSKPGSKFPRLFPVDDVAKAWSNGSELFESVFCCIGDAILYSSTEFEMIRLFRQALDLVEKKVLEEQSNILKQMK